MLVTLPFLLLQVIAHASAAPSRGPAAGADGSALRTRVPLPHITANDNRRSAGTLRGGTLSLQLVASDGLYLPDGESGRSVPLEAFGEDGRPSSSPAPLIRVPAGTELHVSIRNALGRRLVVRGLSDRATATVAVDSLAVPAHETREIRFHAPAPGTYLYWGRTTTNTAAPLFPTDLPGNGLGAGEDSQLIGAFVVDPPVPEDARPSDRVLVITSWFAPGDARKLYIGPLEILAVNGRTWPFNERLEYGVGDTVRWRVVNGAFNWHPMHLHGFFYRVDARGDGLRDTVYEDAQQRAVVTELMPSGSTMAVTWSPSRAGNWLFHCHLIAHMDPASVRLTPADIGAHARNHATDDMAGLVVGIRVRPRPGAEVHPVVPETPRRRLRLFVNGRAAVFGLDPGFSFVLQQGPVPPAPDSLLIPGTPIHLVRGEPTEITVLNRTPLHVSIHWHGIELPSYYDGVAGWSGTDARRAPIVAQNDSFVVRFTPPRAGTFIYHTHMDDVHELGSGLYGPLIVLEPGQPVDTATDRVFTIALGGPDRTAPPWINGSADPAPVQLDVGRTYRFRLINILPNGRADISLREDSTVRQWRPVGKDGASLPPSQTAARAARVHMGPGETWDFEVVPDHAGEWTLESLVRSLGIPAKMVRQRLTVRTRS